MKESCWLASWLARSLLTGCDRCHLSTMKRPEGSPHQSRWCQMLELKHCTQTHTRPCTNINHTRINNICRTVLLLFTMKSYVYTIHEQNHIYLLLLHKIRVQNRAVKNKEHWLDHQVITTSKEWKTSHRLWWTCADKREGRLTAWAITATTSHVFVPPKGPHIMSPPVKYPHAFPQIHRMHIWAPTLN